MYCHRFVCSLFAFAIVGCSHTEPSKDEVADLRKQLSELQKVVSSHTAQLEQLQGPSQSVAKTGLTEKAPPTEPKLGDAEKPQPLEKLQPLDKLIGVNDKGEPSQAEPLKDEKLKSTLETPVVPPVPPILVSGTPPMKQKAELEHASAADLFQRAYKLKTSDPSQASALFARFVKGHPDHPLADNALFCLGSIQASTGATHKAILFWDKILRDYPHSNKTADALFQMMKGYQKLDQPEKAKIAYEQLMRDYPQSEAASLAQQPSEKSQ